MSLGSTQLVYAGKYGTAQAGLQVEEGGNEGTVEYDVQTPLFAGDGSQKPPSQLNAELRAAVQQARDAQGATAPLNPPLSSYVFFSE
jgi:hypothetical protein